MFNGELQILGPLRDGGLQGHGDIGMLRQAEFERRV